VAPKKVAGCAPLLQVIFSFISIVSSYKQPKKNDRKNYSTKIVINQQSTNVNNYTFFLGGL
jgi:hypothetical protein